MLFVALSQHLADRIASWFDDEDTIRFWGRPNSLYREMSLMETSPGNLHHARRVLARHVWVVHDGYHQPCALIVIEPYDDDTAGMALVVAPQRRSQGIGRQVLHALDSLQELRGVRAIIGAVEPENHWARRCYSGAGYHVAAQADGESM
jgi:RimJ/RimL family protein N-acetyltransferase